MPNMGYPLDAYLVIDNNAVVALCEFFCDAYKSLPFEKMVQSACQEVTKVFDKLRKYALGNKIFTTGCVQQEFKPERGVISGYPGYIQKHCERLKAHVYHEIEVLEVNMSYIAKLRGMASTPKRFGSGLCRLSDQDLSLVLLALGITAKFNQRVYILTDEEDLRSFVSWMKFRSEIKTICAYPQNIEALHSLIYLDSAHRNCTFPTDMIYKLFSYLLMGQAGRNMLFGTTKGEMITYTLRVIYDSIGASSEAKQQHVQGKM
ncbi:MAG: hypothetical protein ACM3PY_03305 [Omnitrophica WOR_2 bacterium]